SGYVRTPMISIPGEFSVRGGIIDIFPLTEEDPIRVELFDTEIDSIRYFDVESQRSHVKTDSVTISAATELPLFSEQVERGKEQLQKMLSKTIKKVKNKEVQRAITAHIEGE